MSTVTKTLRIRDLTTIATDANALIQTWYNQGYDCVYFNCSHVNDQHGSDEQLLTFHFQPAIFPRRATFTFASESTSFPFGVFEPTNMVLYESQKTEFISDREINGARLLYVSEPRHLNGTVLGRRHVSFMLFGPDYREASLESSVVHGSKLVYDGGLSINSSTGAITASDNSDNAVFLLANEVLTTAVNITALTSDNARPIDENNVFGTNITVANDTTKLGYLLGINLNVNGTMTPTAVIVWGKAGGGLPTDNQVIATIDAIVAGLDVGGAGKDTWTGAAVALAGLSCVDEGGTETFSLIIAGSSAGAVFARKSAGIIHKTAPTDAVLSTSLAASADDVAADLWPVDLGETTVRLDSQYLTIEADDALDVYPASDPTFSANDKQYYVALFAVLEDDLPVVVSVAGAEANTGSAVYPTEAQISTAVGATTACACIGVFTVTRTAGPVYTIANASTTAPWVKAHNYNYVTAA